MRIGILVSVAAWVVIVVVCTWLGGCATPSLSDPIISTTVVDTGCNWAKPIYVRKGDMLTDATAGEILEHDMTGAERCGWKPTGKK